jgi:lipopolysaccharide/colanic/teichoic acid biosynthesis glycosyltransferase/carbonic anhydrase/acetyltransferase-like protein (isoleucine patch superfamily)
LVSEERLPRGPVRSQHQAIVVVERRMGRSGDPKGEQMAPGWSWVLGNARIGELFDQLFAEARLTWSSMVVPEEQHATFSELCKPVSSPQSFIAYDGRLEINRTSLTAGPDDGEPLYLIFNGHRFPICDLRTAIEVHRQNRCDATLIDFPKPRRKAYDEKFQIDGEGRVKKVDRSYGREQDSLHVDRDWPVLIVMSSQAMNTMLDVSLPHRISQWPGAMLRAGLHLRGGTIPGRSFSLHDREHLFELNEAILRQDPRWLAQAGGLEDQGQKVWVGKNVKIDSTANVIGPVVIGDDVEIGKDAVIVGPTTIGHGAKIGAGIILKRAVVLPRTTLASATLKSHTLSHAIVLGEDTPSVQAITQSAEMADAEAYDLQTVSFDRPIKLEKVLESQMAPLTGIQYRAFRHAKRVIDIAGSLFALVVTMPLWPFVALGIKLNSPGGPIFYGAVRQGRGGKNFRCWKFRTMKPDAEKDQSKLRSKNEVDGPQFKMKHDPRIFRVGRILRKMNLDEIPQFWNVLIGQMSIVGPRPSPEKENQMCPAWREARLSVRPGITGLWQVSRKRDRDDTDFQEWIYYDVQYIKKQSVWLDLKIMFKTLVVAMGGGQ